MSEWKEYKLGEIATRIGDGLHGTPQYDENGEYYFINGNNIVNGKVVIKNDTRRVATEEYERYLKPLANNTILLSINGTIGNVGLYNGEKCMLGKSACYINLKDGVNRNFVYYCFVSKDFQEFLQGVATGTTIPNVPLKGLREYDIKLPSLAEQERIAGILSSLDDKIDLLTRQNHTLEAMAETIFRQYLLNEKSNRYENQLNLGDLIESVSVSHKFSNENVIFLNTSDIMLGEVLVHNLSSVQCLPGQAKKSIQRDDILFSEIRPGNGRWAYIDFSAENYVVSTKLMVLRSKKIVSQALIYFYLINNEITSWLQMLAESRSGTFPQITFDQIRELKLFYKSKNDLDTVSENCENFLMKIKQNHRQISSLAKLRDTLLPKLMNNEIGVIRTE